jgi:hypothetical protein
LEEEPNFLTNYVPVEVRVGSLAYQLRFNMHRVSKKNQVERSLTIGFSGRMGALTGKQLTWGEKSFCHEKWSAFKMASVSGAAYSKNDEITPTLTVLDVEFSQGTHRLDSLKSAHQTAAFTRCKYFTL